MAAPFILLDDARSEGAAPARLYQNPLEIICARQPAEVAPVLARLRLLASQGAVLAGYLAYEAGLLPEPRLAPLADSRHGASGPLIWFARFAGWDEIAPDDVPGWLAARRSGSGRLGTFNSAMQTSDYLRRFAAVREAIHAGDIYQANLTFPMQARWQGDPLAIYAAIRDDARAGYGGILHDGADWLLSFSPELFFSTKGREIRVKPMKGTVARQSDASADAAALKVLAADPKNRAENLMIVDLMRNDLSRIAVPGSVRAEALFALESYPTIHQMTSTVSAQLADGVGVWEAISALFPCGSITGAPKIRAMELIAALEGSARGPYCGSIGRIDANGDAAFNVAIRTLRLTADGTDAGRGGGMAVLGLGSAVVADSDGLAEWRECVAKGGFVRKSAANCDLIESMRFEPASGIPLLERHLERMKASAGELGFAFDRHAIRNAIQALCFDLDDAAKLRLVLARSGAFALEAQPLGGPLDRPLMVALVPLPVAPSDWRLRHKTSDRDFYDEARGLAQRHGADEALLVDPDGRLTEASYSNLFLKGADGRFITPPLSHGLLPGVLRAQLLDEGRAVEGDIGITALSGGFQLGNSVRGLMAARLIG